VPIDWDALVLAPCMGVFGEADRIPYSIAGAPPIYVEGIFDEGTAPLDSLGPPGINALQPVLGVRQSAFPATWDPRNARGDTFVVKGRTYTVQNAKPDSHGGVRIEAKRS